MPDELCVTILEDDPSDAEFIERELRTIDRDVCVEQVSTREAFVAVLSERRPQLILADYALPAFNGLEALRLARQLCPGVPFVLVSGAVGEEFAIESLKQGATDYVLKHRMSRLAPAVKRALLEADEQNARREAESELRRSEERHRASLRINNAIVAKLDRQQLLSAIADALREVLAFDLTVLALHDPGADVLRLLSVEGRLASTQCVAVGDEFPRASSHVGWVFDHRQPLSRRDLDQADLRFDSERRLAAAGLRSYVAVPVIGPASVLGVLCVASHASDHFSDTTAEFLQAVAGQIALAVENMHAYEEIAELKARLEGENIYLQDEIKTQHNFEEVVGSSPAIRRVLQSVEQVAPTDATVLISGETGTGKELIARAVHHLSPRRNRPLVKVNCAALPASLIESELFGHERGAFTGAVSRRAGRFELADGGTIFLDEIGDLPLELQAKLLRVLQEGEFERVGGTQTITVDVRVIAATNHDLDETTREKKFRPDLYYRLRVFPVQMPPIRERREDIPPLVRHFVRKYATKMKKQIDSIPQRTMNALMSYTWPGNVREIENVIERAVILSPEPDLVIDDWFLGSTNHRDAGLQTLDDIQREHIRSVLRFTGGVVSGERGAARILGVKATTLESRMKKLGVPRLSQ